MFCNEDKNSAGLVGKILCTSNVYVCQKDRFHVPVTFIYVKKICFCVQVMFAYILCACQMHDQNFLRVLFPNFIHILSFLNLEHKA